MRCAGVGLILLLAGCSGPDREDEFPRLRYRIDGGQIRSARSLDRVRAPAGSDLMEVWIELRGAACPDPAILVDYASALESVEIEGNPVDPARRPRGLVPLAPHHLGREARLTFRGAVERQQGRVRFGCQNELVSSWIMLDIVQFIAGVVQLATGALLALAAWLRRGRANYAWLALFMITTGIVFVSQSPGLRNHLFEQPARIAWLRDVCSFLYVFAFARFIVQVFGDTRRRLFSRLSIGTLALVGTAVVLDLFDLFALTQSARFAPLLALVSLVAVTHHTWRLSRSGDRAARRFLYGTVALFALATPDLLWGIGLPYHFEFNTSPLGILFFAAAMGSIIEWRIDEQRHELTKSHAEIEARLKEVETKRREVSALNDELRHQIAERSRELGRVLAATGPAQESELRTLEPAAGAEIGRYTVVQKLGAGAMGAVYEVERAGDGAHFALKLMANVGNSEHAERFMREANLATKLSHEGVVRVVDVGLLGENVPFLVMELVRGGDLEAQRARFGDVGWALPVLAQIAEGLDALHARQVVHRDLKPANVLLTDSGQAARAKLADFGIAREHDAIADMTLAVARTQPATPSAGQRLAERVERAANLTQTGALMGTPLYMAPELGKGGRATPASDVFSFGVVAYELLTGAYPFRAPPAFLAMAGLPLPELPPLPAEVPEDAGELLSRALAAEPERRPSARVLSLALARRASER